MKCLVCGEPLVPVGPQGAGLYTCACTAPRHREAHDPRKKGTCMKCGRPTTHPRCIT
jgi:hypothetical protein